MPERRKPRRFDRGSLGALAWFFQNSKDGLLAVQSGTIRRANRTWSKLTGQEAGATEDTPLCSHIQPEDVALVEPILAGLDRGARRECEFRILRRTGGPLWTRGDFLGDQDGWILVIIRDISAERRLRESEARFRGLVTASSNLVYRMSPDWREMWLLEGRGVIADTESPRAGWIDEYVPPEDQPQIRAAIEDAIARKAFFQVEHRVRRLDGEAGWVSSRATPLLNDQGEIVEWFGAATDVTERRKAEEHIKLVAHELNHRVKNNLAMIQAAAFHAFRTASTLEEAKASLLSRIAALTYACDVLTSDAGVGQSLRDVVEVAIEPHSPSPERHQIDGQELDLTPRRAHTLALVLHELATNAVKYGAWSTDGGEVAVTWTTEGAPTERRLRIEWRERGGPRVSPPARRGLGSRLIERGFSSEFGGSARLIFEPAGLVCVLEAPMTA
jgi:two-component sensor histidine kinase/PAS domain-containing protein